MSVDSGPVPQTITLEPRQAPRGANRIIQWTLLVPKLFADDIEALHASLVTDQKKINAVPSSRSEFLIGIMRRGVRAVVEEAEAKAKERQRTHTAAQEADVAPSVGVGTTDSG